MNFHTFPLGDSQSSYQGVPLNIKERIVTAHCKRAAFTLAVILFLQATSKTLFEALEKSVPAQILLITGFIF
jgi:hypothetical protein